MRKPCLYILVLVCSGSHLHECTVLIQCTRSYSVIVVIAAVQELGRALEGSSVWARSVVARADKAGTAQPLAPHLVQFAEAQRIIVMDAIRTDFPQSEQRAAASSGSSTPAMKGEALILRHHKKAVNMQFTLHSPKEV